MQIEKQTGKPGYITLKVSLDAQEWDKSIAEAVRKLSEQKELPGFRPGKAPKDVVVASFGEARVLSAAIEAAIETLYPEAAKQEHLRAVTLPKVSVDQATLETPLIFTAEVVVLPEVELGDYSKINVEKKVEPIEDSQIDSIIENMRKRQAEFIEVERPAKTGDWVEVDFEGSVDGVAFEGGTSKNHPLIIGDKVFIPGFEEGIVDMKAGESKNVEVTFPKDYHKAELANKKATFKIDLHKVKAVNYPDINDEFAKKVSQLETVVELKEDIRKFLSQETEKKANEQVREDAIIALAKLVRVEIPKEVIDQELESMVHDMKHQAEHAGMTFEKYLEQAGVQNEEGLKSQWRDQATERVRAGLALDAFGRAENIQVSDEEVLEEIARLKTMYAQEADKVEAEYAKSGSRQRLKNVLASRKALDRLVEIATSK